MPELYKKEGVEIFSVGNWNGDDYTHDDMLAMVEAFEDTKHGAQPHLKLGHDKDQKLLQKDGYPAAGWIDKVYIKGDKLVADFVDIPKKIFELIQSKAYKKVSCEIFWNIKIGQKTYKRMLAAVALLGADTPGVMNLSDILATYKKHEGNYEKLSVDNKLEFKSDSAINKGGNMPEKTESELKLEFSLGQKETELKAANEKFEAEAKAKADLEAENTKLKEFKAQADAREQKLLKDAEVARTEKFVTSLQTEKLCTPAMAPLVTELLGESKKEYSVKIKDEEKKLSKEDLLKETLKLFKAASDVNFDESSAAGKTEAKGDEETDKLAKEYAEKHKVSYSKALKAVLATKNEN